MDTFVMPRPTILWKEELDEGSEFYTAEAINASDILLDEYLSALQSAEDETAIWKAIEQVVKGFNKLNLQNDCCFIETMEREDLAEYIQKAAEAAGLIYDGDVTEEWREDW
jgi:hypothetical protein